MTRVLVVDDSALDQELAASLLAGAGHETVLAGNGREALRALEGDPGPDLILTDLQMPEMDGLELVEEVHRLHPRIPVVLVTAHGSEEIAAAALRAGAASYVPKRNLHRDLVPTLERVLGIAGARDLEAARRWLAETGYRFVLDNSAEWLRPLVAHFQDELMRRGFCDETEVMQVGMALHEALTNASDHGNLEMDSALRERGIDAYVALLEERRRKEPYRSRSVHVDATFRDAEASFVIRDEGRGFDPATVPDPRDPRNLERLSGRGLLLIRTFMDEVRHNEKGNEITLVKRRR